MTPQHVSWRTATPHLMPKLLSQPLITLNCLTRQAWSTRPRPSIHGHGSSSHCRIPNRFYSEGAALAESGPVTSEHGPVQVALRGFHARKLQAREASQSKLAPIKLAMKIARPQKVLGVRSAANSQSSSLVRRGRAPKQHKDLDWLRLVKNCARVRREKYVAREHYIGLEWEDTFDAYVVHLDMLLAAQRAATKAEKAKEPASAATAKEVRRLEDDARRLAELEAQQKKAFEDLREGVKAKAEARPMAYTQATSSINPRAHVYVRCLICMMPHSPALCPFLIGDTQNKAIGLPSTRFPDVLALFQHRLKADANFREAMVYLKSKFIRAPGSDEAMPLRQHRTLDAPPAAIPFLQEFDRTVWFKSIMNPETPRNYRIAIALSLLQGYYKTTDEDGFPLVILYTLVAPGKLEDDPRFEQEVRLMRSFATCWRKGQKSRYKQEPFPDAQPISIIICEGRWHATRNSWRGRQNALRLAIASEETWKRGEVYRGFHIGTSDNEVTSEYSWWSCGRIFQQAWIDTTQPTRVPLSTCSMRYRRDLVRATLRDVREPETLIFRKDVRDKNREALRNLSSWRGRMEQRAIRKYGADSKQAYMCSGRAMLEVDDENDGQMEQGEDDLSWVPTWETIMNLGQ
ncbi:hypothetical protein VM1G_02478 [Cytospora mali]|uniref:Uncharacterized protein n=1 Tax=Cytospora mali TaxID=578113 RepID=A0A194VS32_CYTMA|nr:hypothetical protein VM1G_02478 [Valsa mali]